MLRVLILSALLVPAAAAQRPAELSAADRAAAVARLDSLLSARAARGGTDAAADSAARSSARGAARLAFPTEGGVFYYRAGEGTAFRRAPLDPLRPGDDPVAQEVGDLARQAERLARDVTRRTGADSGVRDADAGDPRRAEPRDRAGRAVLQERSADRPAAARPPDARPDVTGTPVTRPDLDRVGVAPLDDAPDVTEAEVERAILDTGLFRTSRVFFEFGEAELLPVSQRVLRTVADVLVRYPDLQIEVGGHTDAISSDAFNLELSRRRAGAVAAFLIANGIRGERITSVGYGEARPVATNETETGRALNRRVEFVVVDPAAR